MINHEAYEVIKKLLDSLKNRYQNNLKSMKGSEFFFDYVQLFNYHKFHKINPNWGRSYIVSPDWTKNKKATINPINKKDNKRFQYAVTMKLNHEEIRKKPGRITKTKPFIIRYNWQGLRKFEKNNVM